jgi:hypothetical protein
MSNRPTDAFYVLSALGIVGTQITIIAGPLGSLSAARGACERLVQQGRGRSCCVVRAYQNGSESRVR